MSDILQTYQEEREIQEAPETDVLIGTITSVGQNGVRVQFDGSSAAASKDYPRNTGLVLAIGQRVILQKINGEFVVMAPVGTEQDSNVVAKSDLNDYATKAELSDYATKTELSDYAKKTDLPTVPTFEVATHVSSSINTTAGASLAASLSISKSGFKPIGIVGIRTNETASNQIVLPTYCYLSASNNGYGTISYGAKNVGTTALNSVVFTFSVLWMSV